MRTNLGTDFVHQQLFGAPSAATATVATVIVLSTSTAAPAATDTTFAGELNASGGGLNRKAATPAHTLGTNSTTLVASFTCNSSDNGGTFPVTINKHYNTTSTAAGGGNPLWEDLLTATSLSPGDSIQVTNTQSV